MSIPVLHSAAALLRLAEMSYTGPNSIFIRVLLDKKYALPYRVISALVTHFSSFRTEQERMPVLWHQSLQVFCQRYKSDMSKEQRQELLALMRIQSHHLITPECRRELLHAAKEANELHAEEDVTMDDS